MAAEAVLAELARVKSLLTASPMTASLEESQAPLARAVALLRGSGALSGADQARLRDEVKRVGELLAGVERWLTVTGALTPTYNRRAEWATEGMAGTRGAGLMAEG